MKRSTFRAAAALLALPLWLPTAWAQAGGTNHVWASSTGFGFEQTQVNAPAQASDGNGTSIGSSGAFARADAAALVWRTAGAYVGDGTIDTRVQADSQWEVLVQPGTSGLALGTPIALSLLVRFDGSGFAQASGSGNFTAQSLTSGSASVAVRNPDAPDWDSETQPTTVGFAGRVLAHLYAGRCSTALCGADAFAYTRRTDAIEAFADVRGGPSWAWSGNTSSDQTSNGGSGGSHSAAIDTGVRSFSFTAAVGDRLWIEASSFIQLYCLAGGIDAAGSASCRQQTDLSNTLAAGLLSSVPGIEFAGLQGVTLVPEPAVRWLLLAGAVLLWAGRRGSHLKPA